MKKAAAIKKSRKTQQALVDKHAELNAIIENVPVAIMLVDRERRVRKANRTAEKFAGIKAGDMLGKRSGEALQCLNALEDSRGCGFGTACGECLVRRTIDETFENGKNFEKMEAKLPMNRNGKREELDLLISTSLLKIADERLSLVSIEDVTERRRSQKKIERLASFPMLNPNPIIEIDADCKVTFANQAAEDFLRECGLKNKNSRFLPEDIKDIQKELRKNTTKHLYREVPVGAAIFGETIHLTPQYGVVRIYAVDITERKAMENHIIFASTHDALTGLYNRYHFEKQLEKSRKQKNYKGSVMMIDINDLKKTNDNLGHFAGDKLIRDTANFLISEFREKDLIARFGGDEFCVLLADTGLDEAAAIAERLQAEIKKANKESIEHMRLSISIGIALADGGGELDAAIKTADERMYADKNLKKKNNSRLQE